ncbi:DUF2232 domain-containing protein [Clostridium butanoliproducens]|uniref:DUF2232 domain-containing protein n=1 Tax=Clostridium butanoliproducens TaxID=2991837 RepID=UPI0024B99230|nr:DUF2232 domain-containing protein [Clostridium butanoliproducens]
MKNQKYSTKSIMEAALMSVFIIILIVTTAYVPMLSMVGTAILPIPITVLYLRQNFKTTISCIIISIILTCFLLNPITSITAALNYAIVGLTLGYCIKSERSSYFTLIALVLSGILATVLTALFTIWLVENRTVMDFLNEFFTITSQYMNESLDFTKKAYLDMGVSEDKLIIIDQMKKTLTKDFIIGVIPVTIAGYNFVSAYINMIISNMVLKRLKEKNVKVLSFTHFYITNLFGALLIALVCISIILKSKGVIGSSYLFVAISGIASFTFIINGVATVSYYLIHKKKFSTSLTFIIILFTFLLKLTNIYVLIGIGEVILDLRKLDPYRILRK